MSGDNVTPLKPIIGSGIVLSPLTILTEALEWDDPVSAIVIMRNADGELYTASTHGVEHTAFLLGLAQFDLYKNEVD